MTNTNPLAKAVQIIGLQEIAKLCDVKYQTIQHWQKRGLPLTEFTGVTDYCSLIETTAKSRQCSKKKLLEWSAEVRRKNNT